MALNILEIFINPSLIFFRQSILNIHAKNYISRGQRHGLPLKSTGCSLMRCKPQVTVPTEWFTAVWNSSSGGSNPSLVSRGRSLRHANGAEPCIQANIYTYKMQQWNLKNCPQHRVKPSPCFYHYLTILLVIHLLIRIKMQYKSEQKRQKNPSRNRINKSSDSHNVQDKYPWYFSL